MFWKLINFSLYFYWIGEVVCYQNYYISLRRGNSLKEILHVFFQDRIRLACPALLHLNIWEVGLYLGFVIIGWQCLFKADFIPWASIYVYNHRPICCFHDVIEVLTKLDCLLLVRLNFEKDNDIFEACSCCIIPGPDSCFERATKIPLFSSRMVNKNSWWRSNIYGGKILVPDIP